MARKTSHFVCQQCGYISPNFLGRCPECGNWNTLVEQLAESAPNAITKSRARAAGEIVRTSNIEKKDFQRISTQIAEFDRVLGGGIVYGSVVLVAGDPGIGKSTLLSQLALNVSKDTLYVAGEESARQIKLRIERIDAKASLAVLNETDVDVICDAIDKEKPPLAIVDSVQTLETTDLNSAAGSVSQVRECAHRLQRIAKMTHVPIFIVGHVTKEGTVAGPRTLEHMVDVVLSLEGDNSTNFRVLRSNKNRFGPTDEVGIFEMEESGMKEVLNPSEIFLNERVHAPGSAVTSILTGLRPMLLEVQALVTKTNAPIPRRVGTGVDNNRLQLLVAVLSKRCKLPLYDMDVFVNVTGGIRINDPSVDLAVCMAIYSSLKDVNLPVKACFIGEVGLLGELRSVRQLDKRVSEAKKLGFPNIYSVGAFKSLLDIISQQKGDARH
jgi:DNA repair protein RadA/Sms